MADLGDQQGEQGCGIECIGYNRGFFLLGTIAFMAKEVVYSGFCTGACLLGQRGDIHEAPPSRDVAFMSL